MKLIDLIESIESIKDFPTKGIDFKDITPILKDSKKFSFALESMVNLFQNKEISKVLGIESRGFMLGTALAYKLNAGFLPVRKEGKLPRETLKASYAKEYGLDSLEIHKNDLSKEDVVLIHDDLIATGGTIEAVIKILKQIEVKKIYVCSLIALDKLKGVARIEKYDVEVHALIHF